jgi:branched-chain amino acid transport system substrate-binding protein
MKSTSMCHLLMITSLLFSTTTMAADDKPIMIGSTYDASGPTKETMKGISEGSNIFIKQLNESGGINGRKVEIIAMDDGFKPDAALANAQRLLNEHRAVALFQVQGTGSVAKVGPWAKLQGLAMIAPYTGAANLQEEAGSTLFFTRASYRAESEQIMQHASSIGIKRVGIVYWSNAFGTSNLPLIEAAAKKYEVTIVGTAALSPDGKNASEASDIAFKWVGVQAIVNLSGGTSATSFLKIYRAVNLGVSQYLFSVVSRELLVEKLGPLSRGLTIVQVMPWPWGSGTSLQREFRAAMKLAGKDNFDYYTFEGYFNARVLVDVLSRAGSNPTRESILKAAKETKLDFGGRQVINFKESNASANYTEITMLSGDGRFIR